MDTTACSADDVRTGLNFGPAAVRMAGLMAPSDSPDLALSAHLVALAARLRISRPLCCFDLETTGTSTERDRIVEIAAAFVDPSGEVYARTMLLNPGCPIPPSATAVHGISDADVAGQPRFRDIAKALLRRVAPCDFIGFNVRRFDLPLLVAEFARAGVACDFTQAKVIDACDIFHRKEPRDLTAAVSFYTGASHSGAHRADADVRATLSVLRAQLDRYTDLPVGVKELSDFGVNRLPGDLTEDGRITWRDGAARFTFGKMAGLSLQDAAREGDYLQWVLGKDFPADVKRLVSEALDGRFPAKPEGIA